MSDSIITTDLHQPPRRKRIGWYILGVLVVIGGLFVLLISKQIKKIMKYECGLQLRHIGLGCRMYADTHNGRMPSKWTDLREVKDGPPWYKMLRCPMGGHEEGIEAQVDLWADYRLISGRTTNDPPHTILAVEQLSNHETGANVLFVDGSSTWLTAAEILGKEPILQWIINSRAIGDSSLNTVNARRH